MTENQANTPHLGKILKEYKSSAVSMARIMFVALFCVAIAALFFRCAIRGMVQGMGRVVALSIIGSIFLLPVLLAIYTLFRGILWRDVTNFGITEETRGPTIKIPIRLVHIESAKQSFRTRYGLLSNAHVLLALCAEMANPTV